MVAESILQVVGEADVMACRSDFTDKEVNVGEIHRRLFEISFQLFGSACPELACPALVAG
jgi:hypothetical protein